MNTFYNQHILLEKTLPRDTWTDYLYVLVFNDSSEELTFIKKLLINTSNRIVGSSFNLCFYSHSHQHIIQSLIPSVVGIPRILFVQQDLFQVLENVLYDSISKVPESTELELWIKESRSKCDNNVLRFISSGSVAQRACSCRGLGFDSLHPHGGLQLPGTPVPQPLIPSYDFHRHEACVWCTDMHVYKL